jgi:hypothetical protein
MLQKPVDANSLLCAVRAVLDAPVKTWRATLLATKDFEVEEKQLVPGLSSV